MSRLASFALFASTLLLIASLGCSGISSSFTGTGSQSAASLSASPSSLSFSTPTPNTASQQTLSVQDSGSSPITVESISVSGSSAFSVGKTTLPQSLQPGQSIDVAIAFDPTASGTFSASLDVADSSNRKIKVPLKGKVATSVSVSISPAQASLQVGSQQQFTATVSNTTNQSVTWSVNGVANGNATYGTISSTGMYTAPASIPSGGTVSVSAVSAADTSKSASASVTVVAAPQPVAIAISPTQAMLEVGSQQQFAATVSNTTNTNVTWYVNGVVNGNSTYGTISSSGLYTAPVLVPSAGSVSVTAISAADTSKSASASVTLLAPAPTASISISPTSATVQGNLTQQFTAQVTGTTNTGVNWLVNGTLGGNSSYGTITSAGLYTAPACPGSSTVTVTAQSAYQASVSAGATVSLTPPTLNSTDRYVAVSGSDSNDGSACHPWATVQYAASLAQPGWTVHVGPGTYNVGSGILNSNSGNSSARIVYIGNYDKATWTWNTKLVTSGTVLWSTDSNYIDIVGFDMTSSNLSAVGGIHTGGSYIRIKDNYIHDIYSDSPGAGIMIGGGGKTAGVEVNGNVVAREAHTPGGNTDNECIYTTESHTTIVNNIVFACDKYGIQVYSSLPGGSNYNVVSNNTVFASYRGIVIGGEDVGNGPPTVDYNTITNNIVYGMTSYGLYASGIFGSHNVTSNNLTYDNGTNYSSTYTNQTNEIVSDPLFVNYKSDGTGNYQLQPASPCVDAGTTVGAPAYDFLHVTRPQGSAVDCGAYEYVP